MRAAQVTDGIVTNIILIEEGQAAMFGAVPCGDEVEIGWSYDGTTFAPPPPTPDESNQVVKDNITSAPDSLFGGPTLAEVFNVYN